MDVTSTYKFARISARKARDVAREIQGLPVSAALDLLNFTPRKGAELFNKTMKAALADAENNFELSVEGLFVKSAVVGEGPTFKRFKPRARGSASAILKRTSHITVVLSDDALAAPTEKKKHVSEKGAKAAPKKAKAKKGASKKEVAAKSDASSGGRVDGKLGMVYDSAPADVDDLKAINGVGPKLEEKLNSIGIYQYKQVADWTDANVTEFDELLSVKGRIEKDEWLPTAKALHEEKHGK